MGTTTIEILKAKFRELCGDLSETEILSNVSLIKALERLERLIANAESLQAVGEA